MSQALQCHSAFGDGALELQASFWVGEQSIATQLPQ